MKNPYLCWILDFSPIRQEQAHPVTTHNNIISMRIVSATRPPASAVQLPHLAVSPIVPSVPTLTVLVWISVAATVTVVAGTSVVTVAMTVAVWVSVTVVTTVLHGVGDGVLLISVEVVT